MFAIAGHHLEGDVLRREFALRGVGHPCDRIGSVGEKRGEGVPREPRLRPRGAVCQVDDVGNGIGRLEEERHADGVFRVFRVAALARGGIRRVRERKRDGAGFPVHLGRKHCAGHRRQGVGDDGVGRGARYPVAVASGEEEGVLRVGAPGRRRSREGVRRQVGNGALCGLDDGPRCVACAQAIDGGREGDGVCGGAGRGGRPAVEERVEIGGGGEPLLLQRVARVDGEGVGGVLGKPRRPSRGGGRPVAQRIVIHEKAVFNGVVEIDGAGGKGDNAVRGGERLDLRGDGAGVREVLAVVDRALVVVAGGGVAGRPGEAPVGGIALAGGEEGLAAGGAEVDESVHGVGVGAGRREAVGVEDVVLRVEQADGAAGGEGEARVRRAGEDVEAAAVRGGVERGARGDRVGRGVAAIEVGDDERPAANVLAGTAAELDEGHPVRADLIDPDALDAPGDAPVGVLALDVADAVGHGGVVGVVGRVACVLERAVARVELRLRPAVQDADERVAPFENRHRHIDRLDEFDEIRLERGDFLAAVEDGLEAHGDIRGHVPLRHHRERRRQPLPRLRRQRIQRQVRHVHVVLEREVNIVEVEVAARSTPRRNGKLELIGFRKCIRQGKPLRGTNPVRGSI